MTTKRYRRKPRLKQDVCKPCWELKYCPYGPLVEQFPLYPEDVPLALIKKRYGEVLNLLESGEIKGEDNILSVVDTLEYHWPPRWEHIGEYDTAELRCIVFGHICPVFFVAEPFTETRVGRLHSRRIPRHIMLKVVRRDGQVCQRCLTPVSDNELEFDHVIPHSKGGPVSVENLRVVCRRCNAHKRDTLVEILGQPRIDPDG